jgi:HEPN domain-containing protein
MNGHEPAENIFLMAGKDLAAMEGMLNDTIHFSDEIFGFHAEQAVEKALKAWIAARGEAYPFTHDLSLLLQALGKSGVPIEAWMDLLELASFSVQFRYEQIMCEDDKLDRLVWFKRIKQLFETVALEFKA